MGFLSKIFKGPDVPTPPPPPPPIPAAQAPVGQQAAADAGQRAAMAGGIASTMVTGAQGLAAPPSTTSKKLLGE